MVLPIPTVDSDVKMCTMVRAQKAAFTTLHHAPRGPLWTLRTSLDPAFRQMATKLELEVLMNLNAGPGCKLKQLSLVFCDYASTRLLRFGS